MGPHHHHTAFQVLGGVTGSGLCSMNAEQKKQKTRILTDDSNDCSVSTTGESNLWDTFVEHMRTRGAGSVSHACT